MGGIFVETSINKIKLKKMVVTYNIPIGFDFEEFVKLWVNKVIKGVSLIEKEDFPAILYTEDNAYMYAALQELLNIDEQAAYHISNQISDDLVEETFYRLYPTWDVDNIRESQYQIQEVVNAIKKSKKDCDKEDMLYLIAQTIEYLYNLLLSNIGPSTAKEFEDFAKNKLLCTGIQEQKTHFREV